MTAVRGDYRWIDAERGNPGPVRLQPDWRLHRGRSRLARLRHPAAGLACRRACRGDRCWPAASSSAGRSRGRSGQPVSQQLRRLVLRDSPRHGAHADRRRPRHRRRASRRRGGVRRARAQHVHHGRSSFRKCRSSAARSAASRRCARTWARVPLSAGLRVDAIRRNALEGDPNPFGPRPAFADESVTSVNPRLGDASSAGRTRAAPRARRCVPASARASGRQTPSRSRSPTTRR